MSKTKVPHSLGKLAALPGSIWRSPRRLSAVAVAVVVAGTGLYFLTGSGAAPISRISEAESGVVAGCASTASQAGASGGRAVRFQACGPGGSPVTFTPVVIPMSDPEIPNPIHGQYEWIGNGPDPAGWPHVDVYYRDQLQWGKQIETTKGRYDFSKMDEGLAKAQSKGGLFSFRIMAACPGCGGNLTPSYIPRQSGGQPDWNSETFLSAWENLMKALGEKYDKDPRLGVVDVGGYGSWGEFHLYELGGEEITRANAKRLFSAVFNAFPSKYVVMMSTEPFMGDALAMGPRVGTREDCVGTNNFTGSHRDQVPAAKDRWKTAPFIGEWCGDNPFDLGLKQVNDYHISTLSSSNYRPKSSGMSSSQLETFKMANKKSSYRFVLNSLTMPGIVRPGSSITVTSKWSNVNVAPAYLPWNTMIELRNQASGAIAFAGKSSINLKTFLPTGSTPATINDSFTIPANIPTGSYDVYVKVVSPEGYLKPLNLAIQGRVADGGYKLGTVQVAP